MILQADQPGKDLILIVDDEPSSISSLGNLLQDNYDIMVVTSGNEALNLTKKTPPDLILLDVMMVGMDGYDVCRQLKTWPETRNIPVIFVTSHTDDYNEMIGFEIGGVDYIRKPIKLATARARIKSHIEIKKNRETLTRQAWELIKVNQQLQQEIKDRKEMEDEILKAKKLEAIGILAGGIAHDFNNLLATIIGYLDLLRDEAAAGSKIARYLDRMQVASDKARALAMKLITFSRGGSPVKNKINLEKIIMTVYSSFEQPGTAQFELSIDETLLPFYADSVQLSQVIHNLVTNAVEAMPETGIVSITAINIKPGTCIKALSAGKNRDYVMISVRDRGRGIADHIKDKIFYPYFSTKEQGATKGEGLGLSICHSIIMQHNGFIEVDSIPGEGTIMKVYLPA